jgi:hypothetical protein
MTCISRFGGWNKGLRTAGLKPRRELNFYTGDHLIECLKTLHQNLGRIPTMADVDEEPGIPSSVTFSRRFGNWGLALKAADLAKNFFSQATDKELLQLLVKRASDLGRVPRSRDMGTMNGYPSAMTYQNRFGSWNAALKCAELNPERFREYRPEKLLNCLRDLAHALGRNPTQNDLNKNPSLPSPVPFVRQFGSWQNALSEAGVVSATINKYTNQQLLDAMRDLHTELGHVPKAQEMDQAKRYPSARSFRRKFGTFNNALRLVGLEPAPTRKYSNADLIDYLNLLAQKLKRTPEQVDMNAAVGLPEATVYRRRFGSWPGALKQAGLVGERDDVVS